MFSIENVLWGFLTHDEACFPRHLFTEVNLVPHDLSLLMRFWRLGRFFFIINLPEGGSPGTLTTARRFFLFFSFGGGGGRLAVNSNNIPVPKTLAGVLSVKGKRATLK